MEGDEKTKSLSENKNLISSVTCSAPVNIAVIKYWGKRDEDLILPINGSVSATLDQNELRSKTTVAVSRTFKKDQIWLNGKEQSMDNSRLQNVLKEIKRRARKRKCEDSDQQTFLNWHVHICSENDFPTAAGLASSAAGYACLVFSLAKLFKVQGEITEIARQGSGSACRSLYGGFVQWIMGIKEDGSDSIAHQVAPVTHWPEMRILVLVVSDQKKQVGSTAGMQTSVNTSPLLEHRAQNIVPSRIQKINQAILDKDFKTFAEITMKDSNQFHAACLDTYPPIFYMNDISRQIVQLVHLYNKFCNETKVAYTFDAGPNACLYLLEEDVPAILGLVQHVFPPSEANGEKFVKGLVANVPEPQQELLAAVPLAQNQGAVKYVIHTKVGPGPHVLDDATSLLDDSGYPKTLL